MMRAARLIAMMLAAAALVLPAAGGVLMHYAAVAAEAELAGARADLAHAAIHGRRLDARLSAWHRR